MTAKGKCCLSQTASQFVLLHKLPSTPQAVCPVNRAPHRQEEPLISPLEWAANTHKYRTDTHTNEVADVPKQTQKQYAYKHKDNKASIQASTLEHKNYNVNVRSDLLQ